MITPSPLRWAALAVLSSLTLTAGAFAQTTATWIGGNTTNDYNVGTNWSTASAPNAIDSRAVFTSASSASWTNTTNTLGSVLASGGTVVFGQPSASTNVIVLDISTGKPVLSNSSTLFMYADVQGNEGFTKLGGGDLSFRFNTRNLTYTGDIELLGGTLSVNQASSLGDVNNRLLVGSNAVFNVSPGSNTGNIGFESTRTFVASNGITFSIRTSSNAISATFSNSIVESGTPGVRVDFQNVNSAAVSDATAHKYTIAGTSNNWSGRTTIQLGAKLTLASGTVISTNELNFSSGNGTWAGIDLGGNTQSVGHLGVGGSSTTARTFVISNGVLRVTNPTAAFTFSGANGTLVDISNSTGFVFDGAGPGRNFIVRPDVTAGVNTTNTIILATAGAGSNTITANDIIVGTASGTIGATNHTAVMILGQTNNLSANQFLIGGFNGGGAVQYAGGLSTPSTVIRGSNGVAALNNLIIGDTSSGVRPGSGVLDLSGGNVDAVIGTNFIIGRHVAGANNSEVSSFSMGGGTLTAPSLQISVKTGTGTPTMTDTFSQNGGTVTISNITMGSDAGGGATATFLSTYNLSSSNAVLKAQAIQAGSGTNYSASTRRKINFGAGRIETYDASTDLVIQGIDTTAQGRIEIAVASNAQTKTFFADTGRNISLEPSAVLTFDGGIIKDGAGTLVLKGANVHNGNTTVAAGTVELQSTGSLRFQIGGSGTNNKIDGPGTASLDGQFVFNVASASTNNGDTWNIVSNSLATTYNTNFLVTGFSGGGGNWTNTTNGVDYVFSQSSGNLTVVSTSSPTPYNAWVTYWQGVDPDFTNTAGTDNPDGDPFDNNEEFAFDGNPTIGSPALLTAVKAGTNTVFNYVALTNTNTAIYAVQFTGNLTNSWTNASVTISNSTNQTGISLTNDYARKEFVVPATNNEFYRVQATILP